MADEQKKAVAYAIAEFLTSEIETADESVKESLEVAIQCLESSYNFETNDEEAKALFSVKPHSLMDMFGSFKALEQHKFSQPEPKSAKESQGEAPVSQEIQQQANACKDLGNDAVKAGNYASAVEHYSRAISLCPNNAIYYVNRAAAYTKLDQLDKAIADCLAGLRIDPKYCKGYSRLGTIYYTQQAWTEAAEAYRQALQLDPDNKSYKDNLRAAEVKMRQQAPVPSSPPPDLSGLSGLEGLGGADGNLGALLSNPALMNMAQQFLQSGGMQKMMENPAFQNMASGMAGQGGAGGQTPSIAQLLNDPALRDVAKELQKQQQPEGPPSL